METRRRSVAGGAARHGCGGTPPAHRRGPAEIRHRQNARLAELVAYARQHSAFYGDRAFGAVVREVYGCTESGYSAYGCAQGWLHLLEDWVIVEAVDADHRPAPPGTVLSTVLITNLANRVQPIIRYDVGDRVLVRADPCPCGDPAPAIRAHRPGPGPRHRGTCIGAPGADHRRQVPHRRPAADGAATGGKYRTVIPLPTRPPPV